MVNAQEWLNANIPLSQRINIRKLLICSVSQRESHYFGRQFGYLYESINITNRYYLETSLTGTMNLASFPNLEEIVVEGHFINGLILTGCSRLRKIHASNNLLREVIFPYQAPGLEDIMLTNNNFREQNLSCFTRFTRLHRLFLGTDNPDRINQGIYNRWCGSLIHLLTLTRLQELDINATDINSGLKYLPTRNLFLFTFGNKGRTNARINNLKAEIENYLEFEEGETMEEWAGNEEFEDNMGKVEDIRSWQCHQQQTQFFARVETSRQEN